MNQHYAKLTTSPRLQRILAVLRDGEWHSTLDLQNQARVCAVGTSMSELRRNGIDYEKRYIDKHWAYRLVPTRDNTSTAEMTRGGQKSNPLSRPRAVGVGGQIDFITSIHGCAVLKGGNDRDRADKRDSV